MEAIELFKNGIPDNIVGLINTGEISEKVIKDFTKMAKSDTSYIARTVAESQVGNENVDNLETIKDVTKLTTETIYNTTVVPLYNQAIKEEISNKLSEESKFLREAGYQNYREMLETAVEETLITKDSDGNRIFNPDLSDLFSTEEQNRVLGLTEGKDLFDYSISSGTSDRQMVLDNEILSTLIHENIPEFEQFKIKDKCGNTLFANRYSDTTISFLDIFCKNKLVGNKDRGLELGKASNFIIGQQKKILKAHHSPALKHLCTKALGGDQLKQAFAPQVKALKPAKVALDISKTAIKGTSVVGQFAYKKARKEATKHMSKSAVKKLNKAERTVKEITHPLSTIRSKVSQNVGSFVGKHAKNFLEKRKDKALIKAASGTYKTSREIINRILSPFKTIVKYLVNFVRKAVVMVGVPLFIFLLVVFYISIQQSSVVALISAPIVMPVGNESDFKLWQDKYNELDDKFLKQLEYATNNYAEGTNLKGEKIYYGVNGYNNEYGMENEDYNNGLSYRYLTDEKHDGRTSNIEDVISIMAIMFSQAQSDYIEASLKCIEWLYNISHSFTVNESTLYACDSACHLINYHCYDHFHEYSDTDIKFDPFHAGKVDGEEYNIKIAELYCPVCDEAFDRTTGNFRKQVNYDCVVHRIASPKREDYYGCIPSSSPCFHGDSGHKLGQDPGACTNYSPVYICPGHEYTDADGDTHIEYCDGPLGCEGYYICNGHIHYICPGHIYKCCMGHRNIQMNIRIKFDEEMKDIINDTNFGKNDKLFELKSKYDNYQDYIEMAPYGRYANK